uniref:F-box protein At3g10430 n=1 Tax=Nicotiana sylvestris TaxID=4096 RepID=A0A1U7W972_NICSY|nr:PREDICTED: putative F-box protein At3g10430 [Nicotiana sylvestris]
MADQINNNYDEEEYSLMACSFPKDAMLQILLRLPVKSLLRFRSVCKSWYNFLKSPHFIKVHLSHQISHPASLPLLFTTERIMSASLTSLYSIFIQYILVTHCLYLLLLRLRTANFEFCYNGLIYLMKDIYMSPEDILWNPATRKYKCISVPSECS